MATGSTQNWEAVYDSLLQALPNFGASRRSRGSKCSVLPVSHRSWLAPGSMITITNSQGRRWDMKGMVIYPGDVRYRT